MKPKSIEDLLTDNLAILAYVVYRDQVRKQFGIVLPPPQELPEEVSSLFYGIADYSVQKLGSKVGNKA